MTAQAFTVPVEIRFADLDAYGHVNNALFFTYLETARVKLFQQHFGNFLEGSLMFLVVRSECDYRQPITLNDPVYVTIHTDQVMRSRFDFCYRLHDGGDTTFATAKTTMACYDPHLGKPVALPPGMKKVFLDFHE